MAAESLGELVYTIEADNAQFKNKLKESENLVKSSAAKMSASTKKLASSFDSASVAGDVLGKTAAATGSSLVGTSAAVFELGRSLNAAKAALGISTVAFIKNTAAAAANTVARLALLAVTNPLAAAIALAAVATVTATAAVLLHASAQNKLADSLKSVNERNKERLANLKKLKSEESARVKEIQKQSFIAKQGLSGLSLELFNARGNDEFSGIKNKAVREETIRHIKLKMKLEQDAAHARKLVSIEESRIADLKDRQAKAAKVIADEEARSAARAAARRSDAADRDPNTLFNRARFERSQGQVKSQALLQGLIQALKRGANAAGIAGIAGITGNEGLGGGRAAGATTLGSIGASLARSGGTLGTRDNELQKQTKLAIDANRLLKALVKKRNETVIGT